MRRVLLDEGVPVGIRASLKDVIVTTAAEGGWAGITNGELLAAAEAAGYEIIVTADQNLSYQQNLAQRRIAIIVLSTNHWTTLKGDVARIVHAVTDIPDGGFLTLSFTRPPLRRRPFPR